MSETITEEMRARLERTANLLVEINELWKGLIGFPDEPIKAGGLPVIQCVNQGILDEASELDGIGE